MGKGNRRLPGWVRVLRTLVILGVLVFGGLVGYVCIREGQVVRDVSQLQEYDAIIVLGAQVKPDGTPNTQLEWRLDAAFQAWEGKDTPVVVCGAQGKDEPLPEAEAMARYLVGKGIPEKMILKDPASFNTSQNLRNAKKLLEAAYPEVRRVMIVTSDYHVPRSIALAEDLGLQAVGLGSPCKPEYWLKNHFREALSWVKYWGVKYLHLPLEDWGGNK